MTEKTAAEIMISLDEYPHIPYWFTIRQAVAEMQGCELEARGDRCLPRFVLVFNESYQLLGIVRRRDLLRGLNLSSIGYGGPEKHGILGRLGNRRRAWKDPRLETIVRHVDRPVSDVMRPIKATVTADAPLLQVAREMIDNDMSVIPVLHDGRVTGVVRTVEVLCEVARLIDGSSTPVQGSDSTPPVG